MNDYFNDIMERITAEIQLIDFDGCDISIEQSEKMRAFLDNCLSELRTLFLSQQNINKQYEIHFFKEQKPEILGFLLYFNNIHKIELKCPVGSNDTQREYYKDELKSLTFFFEKSISIFTNITEQNQLYLDEHYFLRGKVHHQLCADSAQFIRDPLFSTGCDYKVAKIICNDMLRIYLNKKINSLEKRIVIDKNRASLPVSNLKWTGSKVAAIELGYALEASKYINRGNADIKEIMLLIETCFNIDLGDYYRTYISIRGRKKDRTPFLKSIIEALNKRMDEDDSK